MSSNNWKIERLKYCRIRKVNGELKYYAVVQGKLVEVDKEVYKVLEHSYHKEFLIEHGKHSNWVSIEQIVEDEEIIDRHGHMPPALMDLSAEEVFFLADSEKDEEQLSKSTKDALNELTDENRLLMLSYIEDNGIIDSLAERDHVSKTAIYRRRTRVRKLLAEGVQSGGGDE